MLEFLFGSRTVERILFFLIRNESCYATQLKQRLWSALSPIQRGLERLERGGLIRAELDGRVRIFRLNPDYPHIEEIKSLLESAYAELPEEMRRRFYEPACSTPATSLAGTDQGADQAAPN